MKARRGIAIRHGQVKAACRLKTTGLRTCRSATVGILSLKRTSGGGACGVGRTGTAATYFATSACQRRAIDDCPDEEVAANTQSTCVEPTTGYSENSVLVSLAAVEIRYNTRPE